MEIDSDGEIVYRGRTAPAVDNPEQTTALVSVLDPIPATDTPGSNRRLGAAAHARPAVSR